MARTQTFQHFARLMTTALVTHTPTDNPGHHSHTTSAPPITATTASPTRRVFLQRTGLIGVSLALGSWANHRSLALAAPSRPRPDVGIVGAGLAGLACADALAQHGVRAALYEASARAGGRVWSLRGVFPGQVAERGGELIDNLHKTMLGYAKRFGLATEDVQKRPGEVFYHFYGQRYAESTIVTEFRDFVSAMRIDLNRLSPEVTATTHTPHDVTLDHINLLAYLDGQNGAGRPAGPLAKAAIVEAFEAEYGRAAAEQSCLNFLLFIHADRRSKFTPFGVFSDERYHLIEGNDRIVQGLADGLSGQISYDTTLMRVRRTAAGRVELTLRHGHTTLVKTHEMVVLTIPFSVLRHIELDDNLNLPPHQRAAIHELGYGTNAKLMVGVSHRPWVSLGSTGASYSDLPNCQTTWETNPTLATSTRGILTDYSSGPRGAGLNPAAVQTEVARFLADATAVYPSLLGAAVKIGPNYLAHLEHWPSNPLANGSYACYSPGQFTTLAGLEGLPAGNLFFAGEHTNSFYEWQGFMEGAALSGLKAATDILAAARVRILVEQPHHLSG